MCMITTGSSSMNTGTRGIDMDISKIADKVETSKDIVLEVRMTAEGKWSMTLPDKLQDTLLLLKFMNIKIDDLVRVNMYPQKPKIEKPKFKIFGR